jgi:uncharacterized protein
MTSAPHPLAASLKLAPHSEGGWFRRIYDSRTLGETDRPVMTSILYLLNRDEHSSWHVLDADDKRTVVAPAPSCWISGQDKTKRPSCR